VYRRRHANLKRGAGAGQRGAPGRPLPIAPSEDPRKIRQQLARLGQPTKRPGCPPPDMKAGTVTFAPLEYRGVPLTAMDESSHSGSQGRRCTGGGPFARREPGGTPFARAKRVRR